MWKRIALYNEIKYKVAKARKRQRKVLHGPSINNKNSSIFSQQNPPAGKCKQRWEDKEKKKTEQRI